MLSSGANGQREEAASFFCQRRFDQALVAQVKLDPHINFLFNFISPAAASDYSAVTDVA